MKDAASAAGPTAPADAKEIKQSVGAAVYVAELTAHADAKTVKISSKAAPPARHRAGRHRWQWYIHPCSAGRVCLSPPRHSQTAVYFRDL